MVWGNGALRTIEGIQVLRAIAALMVVTQHSRHSVPGSEFLPLFGGAGVDIFFIISGFVMSYTSPIIGGGMKAKLKAADIFFRKRLARIVPLYWLALAWVARRDFSTPNNHLVEDFLFIPHFHYLHPTWLSPIIIQGWTLNYEMFFYFVFAIAMLFGTFRLVLLIAILFVLPLVGLFLADDSSAH